MVNQYQMIEPFDRIAVGVSGGKDSSVLLYVLSLLRKHFRFPFELQAIFLDMGWDMEISPLKTFCRDLSIDLHIEKTVIEKIVFERYRPKSYCSLCAKLRRGALHQAARKFGCNKVALGHHLDDAIETFFLNLLYTGQIGTFKPKTYLDRTQLTLIRPLISLPRKTIESLCRNENMPQIPNPCPVSGKTRRQEVAEIVEYLTERYPHFYARFLNAVQNIDPNSFWCLKEFYNNND